MASSTFGLITLYRVPTAQETADNPARNEYTLMVDTSYSFAPNGVLYMHSKHEADKLVQRLGQIGINARSSELKPQTYAEWLEFNGETLLNIAMEKGRAEHTDNDKESPG